jgi:hypothetical protein
MPLPSAGNSISISQIRNELIANGSSYSLRQLSAWAGKSTPDAMSEFYGYSAAVSVDITAYMPSYMGCANYYTFAATSSVAVNTNVNVGMTWYGDLGGYFTTSVTIASGTTCGSTVAYSGSSVNCIGEVRQNEFWTTFPLSNGNQNYVSGYYINDSGFSPC